MFIECSVAEVVKAEGPRGLFRGTAATVGREVNLIIVKQ
jgi:hypothetical protein